MAALIGTTEFCTAENFKYPANRFLAAAPKSLNLVYWGSEISPLFVGGARREVALHGLSSIYSLATSSEVGVKILEDTEIWFNDAVEISAEVNYLVIAIPTSEFQTVSSGNGDLTSFGYIEGVSNKNLIDVWNKGLTEFSPGCLVGWKVGDESEIMSSIVVIDNTPAVEYQKQCLSNLIPISFGIRPIVTTLKFEGLRDKASRDFYNDSEVNMALRVSAYCRNVIRVGTVDCAASVFNAYFEYGAKLISETD